MIARWTAACSRIAGWLSAAGVVLAILFAAYTKGRQDAAATQTEHRLETIKKARKIEDEVDRLEPAGVDTRLREWMRF
ncbi:hypothetical protein J1C56_15680 [Aminobacter anthyllidis]|uniref:Uncharacterized protein n=1 Tax=Aminobacter anthyllidis TaxID=1035067 RepID=A0A9X1D6T8_9HYPH|nr:hypothetical protein [Aminobacter anthyllidis]MBT1157038.1 hypothetical protein [Aminobacter anthyllidis]